MVYLQVPMTILELILFFRLKNPRIEKVYLWNNLLMFYCITGMLYMTSFDLDFDEASLDATILNVDRVEVALSLVFMSRIILFRQFLLITPIYVIGLIIRYGIYTSFDYDYLRLFALSLITHTFLALQLFVSVYHRELKSRKLRNYERILTIE